MKKANYQRLILKILPIFSDNKKSKALQEKFQNNQNQSNLVGNAKQKGRKSFFRQKDITEDEKAKYVSSADSVYAILKINGKEFAFSTNGKASNLLSFDFVGVKTQGLKNEVKTKDNFHAEDWILNSFKNSYDNYKKNNAGKTLDDFLEKKFPSVENNGGANYRHVFSLKINFSPCHGCVNTIKGFKEYLTSQLGDDSFILRIKFLRPYKLTNKATRQNSLQVLNLRASTEELHNNNIPVRMQPIKSVSKMIENNLSPSKFKHNTMQDLFKDDSDFNKLNKTWTELGRNRKINQKTTSQIV